MYRSCLRRAVGRQAAHRGFPRKNKSQYISTATPIPSLPTDDTRLPAPSSTTVAPLKARQFCQLQSGPHHPTIQDLPQDLRSTPVRTPLRVVNWQTALQEHPNKEWVQALLLGLTDGFRIGLSPDPRCRSYLQNSPSALTQPAVVQAFLESQTQQGYMIGPLPKDQCAHVITSSLAVVPKKTPGK